MFAPKEAPYALGMKKTGKLLGIPYEWRRPTVARTKARWWNPDDPRLVTPKVSAGASPSTSPAYSGANQLNSVKRLWTRNQERSRVFEATVRRAVRNGQAVVLAAAAAPGSSRGAGLRP